MGLFVAGAAAMGVLLLGFCVCLTVLMARVNGEVARVLSEAVERIFWPKREAESPLGMEPEPAHSVAQNQSEEADAWEEPPWETEDMEPYMPSSVGE